MGSRRTPCRRTGATCGGTSAFLDEAGIDDLDAVTEATVSAFLMRSARGGRRAPAARRRPRRAGTVVAVRGFHKFCVRRRARRAPTPRPPYARRRRPVACRRRCRSADVEAILDAAGSAGTTLALRDRALLEVLYGTGARISEAVGLDVDDLDRVDGTVLLRGKGGKERLVPVGSYALDGGRRLSDPGPARAGRRRVRRSGPGRCSSTPAAAGSRASRPGPCW